MEDLLLRKGKCRCICHKPTGVKGVFFDMCTSCKCNPLTTPPVNESLDEKFRALCDEYGCRDRAVEIAKELLSTARQEAKAERTEEIRKMIFTKDTIDLIEGLGSIKWLECVEKEFDSLTSKGGI